MATDNYVKLLMHFDNNTFSDELKHTITNNSVTFDTTNKMFGLGSASFNGTSSSLVCQNHSDFNFGTGDFTIEARILLNGSQPSWTGIACRGTTGSPWTGWQLMILNNTFYCELNSGGTTKNIVGSIPLNDSKWHHVCIVRYNGTVSTYVDGISDGTPFVHSVAVDSGTDIFIGKERASGVYFKGNIDEVRISNTARWTSNFTPPTEQYPSIFNYLYLIQDGTNIYSMTPSFYSDVSKIPAMTSNTAPSGIVSASSVWNTTYDSWKAFNGTYVGESDCWTTVSGTVTGWLKYDFGVGNEKQIGKYSVRSRDIAPPTSTTSAPKTWTFEGSNDNINWSVLDSRTNETNWLQAEKRTYSFINYYKYRYYRINITANNGYTTTAISELEMMEFYSDYYGVVSDTPNMQIFSSKGIGSLSAIDSTYYSEALKPTTETIDYGKLFSFPLKKNWGSFREFK